MFRIVHEQESFEKVVHVVWPARVPENVVTFLKNNVKKISNGMGEVNDALYAIVNVAKFNCYFSELWRADRSDLNVVCNKEESVVH